MKRLFLCFFIFLFVSEFVMASESVNVKEQNKISGSYRLMENINSIKPYLESHFNVYLEVMSEVNSLIHELITSDEVLMRNKVYSSIKKKDCFIEIYC